MPVGRETTLKDDSTNGPKHSGSQAPRTRAPVLVIGSPTGLLPRVLRAKGFLCSTSSFSAPFTWALTFRCRAAFAISAPAGGGSRRQRRATGGHAIRRTRRSSTRAAWIRICPVFVDGHRFKMPLYPYSPLLRFSPSSPLSAGRKVYTKLHCRQRHDWKGSNNR